jgi:hypothetical protein
MRTTGNEEKDQPSGSLMGFVSLSNFELDIDADGGNAFITLIARGIGIFRLRVAFALMSRFQHAVDMIVNTMRWRQGAFIDGGADSIERVKASALRPNVDNSSITLEHGEVVMLLQFDEAPPLAIKLTPEKAEQLAKQYYAVRVKMAH